MSLPLDELAKEMRPQDDYKLLDLHAVFKLNQGWPGLRLRDLYKMSKGNNADIKLADVETLHI